MKTTETLWKTLKKKVERKRKAFVDNNLQMQIPDSEPVAFKHLEVSNKSVYTHFCRDISLVDDLTHIESELNAAMTEVRQTHQTWKKMQNKLAEMAAAAELDVKK